MNLSVMRKNSYTFKRISRQFSTRFSKDLLKGYLITTSMLSIEKSSWMLSMAPTWKRQGFTQRKLQNKQQIGSEFLKGMKMNWLLRECLRGPLTGFLMLNKSEYSLRALLKIMMRDRNNDRTLPMDSSQGEL